MSDWFKAINGSVNGLVMYRRQGICRTILTPLTAGDDIKDSRCILFITNYDLIYLGIYYMMVFHNI